MQIIKLTERFEGIAELRSNSIEQVIHTYCYFLDWLFEFKSLNLDLLKPHLRIPESHFSRLRENSSKFIKKLEQIQNYELAGLFQEGALFVD